MARTRNIKPSFFDNDILAECDPLARLAFAGLWCHADREGRMEYRPKRLKANILPYDDCDFDALINELARRGFLHVYEVSGTRYLQVTNFAKHQNPHKAENPSTFPEPCWQSIENKQEPESTEEAPNKYGASSEEAQNQPGLNLTSLTLPPSPKKDAVSQPQLSQGQGKKKGRRVYPESFEAFWREWLFADGGGDKAPAFEAWNKLTNELQSDAQRLAAPWFKDWRASNRDASAIHAQTYLNQQRFDGFDPSRATTATGPPQSETASDRLQRQLDQEAANGDPFRDQHTPHKAH